MISSPLAGAAKSPIMPLMPMPICSMPIPAAPLSCWIALAIARQAGQLSPIRWQPMRLIILSLSRAALIMILPAPLQPFPPLVTRLLTGQSPHLPPALRPLVSIRPALAAPQPAMQHSQMLANPAPAVMDRGPASPFQPMGWVITASTASIPREMAIRLVTA